MTGHQIGDARKRHPEDADRHAANLAGTWRGRCEELTAELAEHRERANDNFDTALRHLDRAERAEAKVARVEGVFDDWDTALTEGRCPSCSQTPETDCDHGEGYHHAYSDLRAALAGEGER